MQFVGTSTILCISHSRRYPSIFLGPCFRPVVQQNLLSVTAFTTHIRDIHSVFVSAHYKDRISWAGLSAHVSEEIQRHEGG
jgi:hypothetical protein